MNIPIICLASVIACCPTPREQDDSAQDSVFVVVLGVAQDAGYPQANCQKNCCELAWNDPHERKFASSVAVVDLKNQKRFIFDCTPNFPDQLRLLDSKSPFEAKSLIDGIFLTHAHVGHYTGLIHLGREAIGAKNVPVYGTAQMNQFLSGNGPWSQLVSLSNIELNSITPDQKFKLTNRVTVTPFQVPHRDEFSNTVGFRIESPNKSLVYLPDIDKWNKWNRSIEDLVQNCDYALLDGTFFADGEIPGRDMNQIPHPFVQESIARFAKLEKDIRNRVHFIHLNHTNPAIRFNGDPVQNKAARQIENAGLNLARQGQVISLH